MEGREAGAWVQRSPHTWWLAAALGVGAAQTGVVLSCPSAALAPLTGPLPTQVF